jgi:hypothetical protein
MTNDLTAIRERGFNALTKELGPSGMAIFMRQFENGNGNYTEERDELLKDLTIDDIVSGIKKRKGQNMEE